jgi:hypothetical protein
MIRRRNITVFSLSFLDCICCGFGAIILLFVLTMGSQNDAMVELKKKLEQLLQQQLTTLARFKTQRDDLQVQQQRAAQVVTAEQQQDSLRGILAQLEAQIKLHQAGRKSLLVELDDLKKEIAARQQKKEIELPVQPTPIGLPANATHIAFIIDSSGSMRDPATGRIWEVVMKKFDEVLDSYPKIEGVQFLDADGRYILRGPAEDEWLPDSPEIRTNIKEALRRYSIHSNSNPVPGIFRALRRLHDPEKPDQKMMLFILGDEFNGTSDAVLNRIDQLNPPDSNGKRGVVINAVGFPTAVKLGFDLGNTGVKFANLMREVTYQHGGAFIALQDVEIYEEEPARRR